MNVASAPALILAYDGSPESRRALEHAAGLAGPGGEITVINVVRAHSVGARLEAVAEAERARQLARLEEARTLLDQRGVRTRTVSAAGDPYAEIVALARDRSPSVVVVGRRRHVVPGRSLSARLVRGSSCDVLIVG